VPGFSKVLGEKRHLSFFRVIHDESAVMRGNRSSGVGQNFVFKYTVKGRLLVKKIEAAAPIISAPFRSGSR